jgi:macrolide-specific efflux system membrane fusion protein
MTEKTGILTPKSLTVTFLIAATAIGFWTWKTWRAPSISYREMTAKRGDLIISIVSTGTVQPENRLEVKPPIAGRVEDVLIKEGQKVKKGQILIWMSSTERAALLDAARGKGTAEVKRWEELYRPTPVIAPISGTIILKNVESGQTFTNSDSVLVMSDRLTVKAQVDETDISQVKLRQPAEIMLDAYSNQKLPARVDQIAFEAKTVNNVTTYLVDVLPDKTPQFMRSGMTANVTFFVDNKKDVLLIPNEAIVAKGNTMQVLLKSPSGQPIEKEIKTGLTDGKQSEVLEGLVENDVVLTAGPIRSTKSNQNPNPFSPMGGGKGRKR